MRKVGKEKGAWEGGGECPWILKKEVRREVLRSLGEKLHGGQRESRGEKEKRKKKEEGN